MEISSIFDSYINSLTQSSMIDALSSATQQDDGASAEETGLDRYTLELAGLFNIDVSSILASSTDDMAVRQALVNYQHATLIDYNVLMGERDNEFSSLIGTSNSADSGSAAGFFTEDYMSSALEMLSTNPDIALVAQASAQATSVLDLFS